MHVQHFRSSALGGGFSRLIALLGGFFALASMLGAATVVAQKDETGVMPVYPEYQVKAAFLLNFTKYVYWPKKAFANESSSIVVGILGDAPSEAVVEETFTGRKSHGRQIEVRRLQSTKEASGCCQLIFLSRAERHRLPHLLAAVKGEPVLVVGELERFVRDGGGISLLINEQQTLMFEMNLDVMKTAGLRVRTDFFRLAERVWTEGHWVKP